MPRFLTFAALALAAIAAFPVVIEIIVRRAVRRADIDRSAGWFGGAIEIQWAVLGFWATWFGFCLGLPARAALAERLAPDLVTASLLSIAVLPPLATSAWAQYRLSELSRVVRATEGDSWVTFKRLLRPVLAIVIAMLTFGFGPALVARGVPPVPLLLAAILCALAGLVFTQTPAKNETPNAVTAGELRDRIVAIAQRAGVRVKQFYVMPQTRARMANAFAAQNNSVLVTDYLLAHLDRDEVDAVIAHELAHLHRQDPQRMLAALLGVAAAVVCAWVVTQSAAIAAVIFAIGMLAFLAICRRFEYGADAGALRLGARGEALITGLARLARLNHVPLRWGRRLEWTLTHPSLERRAFAIARHAAIPAESVDALLEDRRAVRDPYALPPALLGAGKVFSTAFKLRLHARSGWTLLLVSVIAPALVLAFAPAELSRGLVTLAALIAAVAATTGTAIALSSSPFAAIRRRLAERLAERGLGAHAEDARFVGLSPGSEARIVEGFYVWDVGFLKLTPGWLDYVGEETSFSMPVSRVQKLDLVSGPPTLRRSPVVRVTWLDDQGSWCTLRLFVLEPRRGHDVVALFEALDAWRRAGEAPMPGAHRLSFGAPRHHEVTSIAPRDQVRAAPLVVGTVLQFVLAIVVTTLLGRPLVPWIAAGWAEVMVAAIAANLALLMPALLHGEPARIERRSEVPERAA